MRLQCHTTHCAHSFTSILIPEMKISADRLIIYLGGFENYQMLAKVLESRTCLYRDELSHDLHIFTWLSIYLRECDECWSSLPNEFLYGTQLNHFSLLTRLLDNLRRRISIDNCDVIFFKNTTEVVFVRWL